MTDYKFVKVASYYREFLNEYYGKFPSERNKPYKEQLKNLLDQSVGWSDHISRHLTNLGAEAHEIIHNAEPLQNMWAQEEGIAATGKDIVLQQLKIIKPEVVMFQDSITFNGQWIKYLRENVPSIKLIIGWCCSPVPVSLLTQYKSFDFSIVCSPKFSSDFSGAGLKSYQIYHGFETSLLERVEKNNNFNAVDFIFTGSIFPGAGFHDERVKILEELIKSGIDISILGNIPVISPYQLFLRRIAYASAKALSMMGLKNLAEVLPGVNKALYLSSLPQNVEHSLSRLAKPPIFGLDMFKALYKSKITFNNHGEAAGDYAANMRLFEATGIGSCLITDYKKNIAELFDPDSEIVVYNSAEECIEKVKWLLNHTHEREAIAAAGQKRTLSSHTLKQRAEVIDDIIRHELS